MPRLGYSFYEFALWNKKQSAIDMAIQMHGSESIRKAVLAHFKVQTFNELTRTLNNIPEEEFDLLVYGIKPDEED